MLNFPTDKVKSERQAEVQGNRVSLDRVAVIILGGGEGTRLKPLTLTRCKPAISFGGRYTLIDVPISQSLTIGLSKIFVIGQYLVHSLQKHLLSAFSQNRIQLLIPEARGGKQVWYKGTADAIRQNLHYFNEVAADYFLILSGDQLYNINFQKLMNFGVSVDAGLVIAGQPVTKKDAQRMGLLKVEQGGSRIYDFYEKPQEEAILERFFLDDSTLKGLGYDGHEGKNYLGSMGIYFFKRKVLFDLLQSDVRDDFGKHLVQTQMQKGDVHAFMYDGYWEDIGTIESYYNANLALTGMKTPGKAGFQWYDETDPIITRDYNLPGAKIGNCKLDHSIICEGSVIGAQEITHSIIGVRSIIDEKTIIRDSILLGNEFYERPPLSYDDAPYRPRIGKNCFIEKAIIDDNVTLGDNVTLSNRHGYINYDSEDGLVTVRDGIIVIPRGTIIPNNYTF